MIIKADPDGFFKAHVSVVSQRGTKEKKTNESITGNSIKNNILAQMRITDLFRTN